MSDPYYDQGGQSDQSSWVQPAGNPGRGSWPPEQSGQTGQGQSGWSQQQSYQGQMGQDPLNGPLEMVRQHIENQIHQAIDQYANRIPGGSLMAPEAKRAASSILDSLERQADTQIDSRIGNIGGGLLGGNQNNQGGQL